MASQISASGYHSGQMLWALTSKSPYWPSIVCPSDSGQILDESPQQSVHVRFIGYYGQNRNNFWVKFANVFDFEGYESFVEKKLSMRTVRRIISFICYRADVFCSPKFSEIVRECVHQSVRHSK